MLDMSFTIVEDGRAAPVAARVGGGRIVVPRAELEQALGWSLKEQGLCRGEVCVPVPRDARLADEHGVDLHAFAALLDRPLAVDEEARAACIGDSANERASMLRAGEAPDFTLPDLSGRMHGLRDHRGRKVLLIAWASW